MTKASLISPIRKAGSRALPKNYRPVSLTSHIIKVFERILKKHLVNYLESNKIMNPNQHSFRTGRSCLSQLLAQYDNVLKHIQAIPGESPNTILTNMCVVGSNGEWTSQSMFYVPWGLMKKFSGGFLISVSLSATDPVRLIKNLILSHSNSSN